jgi:hypothetical protein
MERRILASALVLSAILGVGLARAQATPDTTAASPPAVTTQPAPAPPASEPVKPPTVYYEKARVVVDGQAEANGSLSLTFSSQGAEGKAIHVNVLAKASKKDVARDIQKELSIAAGTAYKVKLDKDTIHISKADKKTTPNFGVSVDKLEVGGVSVRVAKD